MKKLAFFMLVSLVPLAVLAADQPGEEWVRRYNGAANSDDTAYALAVDSVGNVYVTGESPGSGTYEDYAMVKYDTNGNELWVRRYSGSNNYSEDGATALAVDRAGNVYVTGYSQGNGSGVHGLDYATIKYSQNQEPSNTPPVANAGQDQTITIDDYCRTTSAILGTASDPDNNSLKYRWLEGQTVLSEWSPVGATGEAPLNLCTVSLNVGAHTLTLAVTDNKATASDTMILTIIYPYSGFFQPVGNTPALNILKAGASVPVKFSLKGYRGLDILKAGFPTSSRMACPAGDLDAIEQLVTANTSSLNYDATTDQYIYVWKTTKTWSGTCRRFTLTLIDGTVHEADFLFR